MALLPYLDDKDAKPEVLAVLKARPKTLNVQRMMANAQSAFVTRSRLSQIYFHDSKLSPRLREIAILRTAKDCHSVYEWTQHVPAARHVGVSEEQIVALDKGDSTAFNEVERLVLKLVDEVIAGIKGSRETVEGLKKHLSAQEMVELMLIIGQWRQTATIIETFEVDFEDYAGQFNILEGTPVRK